MAERQDLDPFVQALVGKDVYVKLAKDWNIQGRLVRADRDGLVIDRPGTLPVYVNQSQIGTIEEAQ